MSKKYQHFALDSMGRIIAIKDAKKDSDQFFCPYCKGEMIAKQGEVREWHFAHKNLTNTCNYETYLHSLAKIKLCEKFRQAQHIYIEIDALHRCHKHNDCKIYDNDYCTLTKPIRFDLKEYYDVYEMEKNYDDYRADIFIGNSNNNREPVFVEIYVTHACEEKKVDSGIRIIEICIKTEQDIDDILNQKILKETDKIKLYNFKAKTKDCRIKKSIGLRKFIFYNSGKAYCENTDCKKFRQHRLTSLLELTIYDIGYFDDDTLYKFGYIYAYKLGISRCSCTICRFHKLRDFLDWDYEPDKPIFCCLYKKLGLPKYCSYTSAQSCSGFNILKPAECNEIEEKYKDRIIDIWKR